MYCLKKLIPKFVVSSVSTFRLMNKSCQLVTNMNNHNIFYFFQFLYISFTFMHLADAFIQSDLHCIQVTVFTFLSALAFPGNRTHDLSVASAMLYYLSYRKA